MAEATVPCRFAEPERPLGVRSPNLIDALVNYLLVSLCSDRVLWCSLDCCSDASLFLRSEVEPAEVYLRRVLWLWSRDFFPPLACLRPCHAFTLLNVIDLSILRPISLPSQCLTG